MIVIAYAYQAEISRFKKLIENSKFEKLVTWQKVNEADSLSKIKAQNAELILNVGFGGALNPNLALGEVVLVDKILCIKENKIEKQLIVGTKTQDIALDFAREKKISFVSLLTAQNPVTDSILRDELRQKTKADIVDMEGSYLLKAAGSLKVPFVSLKLVSDNADNDTMLNVKQYGKRWSKILGEVAFDFLSFYLDCEGAVNRTHKLFVKARND